MSERNRKTWRSLGELLRGAGCAFLVALPFAGCATAPPATSLDRAIADYDAGRFAASLASAEQAASRGGDILVRDEAAYLAGMSAYRLGRDVEARRWLSSSATSSDAWLAGQSLVTLGSVELRGGDATAAARAFVRAAERLPDPDESARARTAAGWAYRQLGDDANAKAQFALAKVPVSGPVAGSETPRISLPRASEPTMAERTPAPAAPAASGAFTIQAGAFRDSGRARNRAEEIADRARKLGLGAPAVREKRTAAGVGMWVVQVGRFPDRAAAEKAKARLGSVNLSVERALAGS
jgi:cell division septation protein DedD